MLLKKLRLENFQGIRELEYHFNNGQNADIYGQNASGKTTLFNAFAWLLFDKASTGAKSFTPKTIGADGEEHNLDHTVEAELLLDSGISTIKKVYHEIHKKKRGSATTEFTGHTTEYYIDGVPVKEKEYTAFLESIASLEEMKILTMPYYFVSELNWTDRRKILLSICGDISDETVSSPELAELFEQYLLRQDTPIGGDIKYYTVDEYSKIAKGQLKELNSKLQLIPARIDEANKAIPELEPGVAEKDVDLQLTELQQQLSELNEYKAAIMAGDSGLAKARFTLTTARNTYAEAKSEYLSETATANEKTLSEIAAKEMAVANLDAKIARHTAQEQALQKELEDTTHLRNNLLERYRMAQKKVWDEGKATCPTCKQPLPMEQVQGLRAEFNKEKSETLLSINQEGKEKASQSKLADLAESIDAERKAQADSIAAANTIKAQLFKLKKILQEVTPFEKTDTALELEAKIHQYTKNAELAAADTDLKAEAITAQISDNSAQISTLRQTKAQLQQAAVQRGRIETLKSEEKRLAKEYERVSKGLYLCELFIKTKVSLITDGINTKFKSVRFRLFVEQINGGVKEDCEVMIPAPDGSLIPYAVANNAARINAGLEIIDVLGKHWGVNMPVFVDNAESVTKLKQIDSQVIRLIVSEQDKSLRMELVA